MPASPPNWRLKLDRSSLLQHLREIKSLDGAGREAIASYIDALKERNAAIRYWAVVGLHSECRSEKDVTRAKKVLKKMLLDRSPVVRIAAARAFCDWGEEKDGLPVLVEALKYKNNKAGLYAVIALEKIGEKARPALSQIRDCLKDSDGYVKRVAQTILENLKD